MTSTFATHSPGTYDRAAILVSPNPLALPAYGDRVYSPNSGVFKNAQEIETAGSAEPTPVKLEAPPVPELAKPAQAKSQTRASIRFQKNLAEKKFAPLPRDDLSTALLKFPRSPYPSAPGANANALVQKENRRPMSLNAETKVNTSVSRADAEAEDRLSQEFWRSVTIEEPRLTVENPMSPGVTTPRFMFGARDGTVWSPGPRRNGMEPVSLSSVLSPFSRTTFAKNANALMSPTPNDPFSAFPSFTAVLSKGAAEMIAYPPRAVVEL